MRLSKAMNRAVKLSTEEEALNPSAAETITDLCHSIFADLTAVFLPLVPQLRTVADCIIPLYACSEAGYWGPASPASADGKGGLAVALLQRLSADGCVRLKPPKKQGRTASSVPSKPSKADQDHANLWRALAAAPAGVRSSVDLRGLLDASADGVVTLEIVSEQACSNILLACSRLQLRGFDRLIRHLTARLVDLGPAAACQALANALYALGELAEDVGHTPRPEDLEGLARAVVTRLSAGQGGDSFTPQALSNMLYACSKLSYTHSALIGPLAAAAGQAASRMAPQGLANSAWALARMGYADQTWYAAAVQAAERPGLWQGAKPQDWSNLWYALALPRHRPASSRLLERTTEASGVLQEGATAQGCANLLWALANLRLYDERLVGALAGRLGGLLRQDPALVTQQELCNSLWALAVMGPGVLSRHSGLVEGLLREAVRRWVAEGHRVMDQEGLRQLWQVQLELEAMGGGDLSSILRAGKGSLLTAARAAISTRTQTIASGPASSLEAEVASALEQLQQRMGPGAIVSVQRRCVVEEVGRVAETVVELAGGRRVVVETLVQRQVFASTPPRRMLTGPVELHMRQLGRVPSLAKVLSVPEWEWEEAKAGGEAKQRAYLCRLLGLRAA
ncbi:hypothetical protein HYH03_004179 [Edaphochlamys debaryana]|uniref:RAP domain-containing protein n=1 Tax=Edaphochlamys debaryana TaxID=47281 RepID=A0A835YFR3_9CHLO|nr:hypothetical protein HYH03_004179 [Edaphochlamys debaryana]|eukprot:KAG2497915.1 hypothetical protein HYH03_004179 [Edaphochlamys debaryana]